MIHKRICISRLQKKNAYLRRFGNFRLHFLLFNSKLSTINSLKLNWRILVYMSMKALPYFGKGYI